MRVPGWCRQASVKVNGETISQETAGKIITINREWKSGDHVELDMPMHLSVSRWYENSAVIERGPLIYALKMGEKWRKVSNDERVRGIHGDFYYEVHPSTPWNYCLIESDLRPNDLQNTFKVVEKGMDGYPWNVENAPVEIHTKARRMPQWQLYNESAGPLPYSTQDPAELAPEVEDIVLIPYGCTTLRITEFPVSRK